MKKIETRFWVRPTHGQTREPLCWECADKQKDRKRGRSGIVYQLFPASRCDSKNLQQTCSVPKCRKLYGARFRIFELV